MTIALTVALCAVIAAAAAATAYAEGRDTERARIDTALRDMRRNSVHRHRVQALTAALDLVNHRGRR